MGYCQVSYDHRAFQRLNTDKSFIIYLIDKERQVLDLVCYQTNKLESIEK